jgi:poly(A)-specific ribonuclease
MQLRWARNSTSASGTRVVDGSICHKRIFHRNRRTGVVQAENRDARTGSSGTAAVGIMEVTKNNFAEVLPEIETALSECSFYAFDCEMTGLFVSENRNGLAEGKPPAYLHDIEDRYEELQQSSEAFVINQFGLSAFRWEEDSKTFVAKTFNFYTFPRPFEEYQPRFLSEAGSLQFLSEHNFDFNKWIYGGIPYMPISLRDKKLKALEDEQKRNAERNEIVPTTEVDKMLVADLRVEVRRWLAGHDRELLLSPVNSYQRALQYQELRKDQFGCEPGCFPGFYPEKVEVEGNQGNRAMIKLVRASPDEIETREREISEGRRRGILDAAGFSSVLEAMRECSKPAVGHNLAFDIAYSIHSFVSPLPSSWEDFREIARRQFPGGIFDTKLVAQKLLSADDPNLDTSLAPLYGELISKHGNLVSHAEDFNMYSSVEAGQAAHDAGYDAYMTGAAFACLLEQGKASKEEMVDEDDEEGEIEGDLDENTRGKGSKFFPTLAYRMYVTNSDLQYASFSGSQDYPPREHIVYVKDIPQNQQIRRGNDLARNLGRRSPVLMGSRVTTLEYGAKALVEFQDGETAKGEGIAALREMFPEATVLEYAQFREERRERLVFSGKKKRKSVGQTGNNTGSKDGSVSPDAK